MEQPQILSLEEQAAIEQAREKIYKHAARTYDLLPFGRPLVDFGVPISRLALTRTPVQPKAAVLKIQLREHSSSLFDAEAQFYPKHAKDEAELRSLLESLALRIQTEVTGNAFDESQDFHCSEADRTDAIRKVLENRVDHWIKLAEKDFDATMARGRWALERAARALSEGLPTPTRAPTSAPDKPEIPQIRTLARRASWLTDRFIERAWNRNDPGRFGGPDPKTIDKILAGAAVREDVLERLALALSKKYSRVSQMDIPRD